ncbi:amidase [Streptomyces californicus]
MARTARDLTLLLDVMAGPDPLTSGVAHTVTLPPARHERLCDFRVLVLDAHPLLPTGAAVRSAVERVARALADVGARVERHSLLLPDLAESRPGVHAVAGRRLVGGLLRRTVRAVRARAAGLAADDRSLDAARLRGTVLSHRAWLG